MSPTGLRRIKLATQVTRPIVGEKIWYASGMIRDGGVVGLYQKSLCLIIGNEGVMFTTSFWLPKFLVRYFLLPWSQVSDQSIDADRFEFHYQGMVIHLFGNQVTKAVRRFSPSFNSILTDSSSQG